MASRHSRLIQEDGVALLVRHAHAGSRGSWDGPDDERPLSHKGRRQAEALVGRLAKFSPTRVLCSPFLRCVQTVEPFAEKFAMTIDLEARLQEGSGAALLDGMFLANQSTVLCTHGDVVRRVLVSLASKGVELPPVLRDAKGSIWVLRYRDGEVVSAKYLEAPSS